ncbi:MAG: L-2-hydroxyglutarate oxidase [Gemmatimonadota bacterium]|nr:L-2-hydroxyglutarate oxidase [Gemmatimonadota bacterium]
MTTPGSEAVDFLVVGGGIVGITCAAALKRKYPDARVRLIEKDATLGSHASGRNSGVLHAGFYYSSSSLKARFSRDGCRRLTEYCLERDLPINRCGKLVVAQSESDHAGIDELKRRAEANGVRVEEVDEAGVAEIEPRARTVGRALFSPTTASVHPGKVLQALAADAKALGVEMLTAAAYIRREGDVVHTAAGSFPARFVVNAAGLYADTIAHDHGIGRRYRILPFKGLYLFGDKREKLRTNIYPVPDLGNPFAGVHFTVTVDGHVKIGPTATPAFWREQYAGLSGFKLGEFAEIAAREISLLTRNDFGFRDLAMAEIRKYSRPRLAALAARLVPDIEPEHFRTWGPPGIRAQLFDVEQRKLEMDFVVEGDERSLHVLNAVSPAFTCSLPFADHLVERVGELVA